MPVLKIITEREKKRELICDVVASQLLWTVQEVDLMLGLCSRRRRDRNEKLGCL